ncbi:MAG: hypothetical protein JWM31_1280 [Solirubrobacterales bacterium]|nr:hypothetical protein [Solirubrobacterales bacterium]
MTGRGAVLAALAAAALTAGAVPAARADDAGPVLAAVQDLGGATFGARDQSGAPLDGLDVLQVGPARYVGVHHALVGGHFETHLVSSSDLRTWRREAVLAQDASQPAIAPVPDGGFVVADERGSTLRLLPPIVLPESITGPTRLWLLQKSQLRFRFYPTLDALLSGKATRTFVAPRRLSRTNEGTPSIVVTRSGPGVAGLTVSTGLHVFEDLDGDGLPDADRQATGVLRGFRTWTATRRPDLDAPLLTATSFHAPFTAPVAGSIGDRDDVTLPDGRVTTITEAQYVRGDFSSWRLFLRGADGAAPTLLNPVTPGGSTSFGNPSLTSVTLPDGRPALVFTAFVFGGAPGEGGPLIHVQPLG